MSLPPAPRHWLAPCLLLAAVPALSQNNPTPPAAPASAASAPTPARPPAASPAPAPAGQRVEITGAREGDTEARRNSTAAKIVIGREEIEKFGDATVGEVLRRLPGVTTPGAPGRGGPPRMRGLGGGFTQLLIDGQRLPPGFSLDSLTPAQIERIEVLRAPTAETGARAIAGTINIITREGFKRRLNDLRLGGGVENGKPQGGVFWSHNDNVDALTYTLSAGLFANRRRNESRTDTELADVLTGTALERRHTETVTETRTVGMNLNARLQWRLGQGGDSLILMPGVFANHNVNSTRFDITELLRRDPTVPSEYADFGTVRGHGSFIGPRLMVQYRQRVGDWRLEGGGNGGASRSASVSDRYEFANGGGILRTQFDDNASREKRLSLNIKGSRLLGGEGSEHSLVTGAEIETARRNDTRVTVPDIADAGENFEASTLRVAAFVQDEWSLNQHWSFHGGLRWEGITTRGDDGQGNRPTNRNGVTTPLLHLLWKPDPKVRDQVRLSLTRSWRAPETNQLIGRPSINRIDPVPGANLETTADSAGNPDLKPELATGVDLAFERYLSSGGLLSANLFARHITDLMRSEVRLEDVWWSPGQPRYVRRTRNIGKARTYGIELEAKFRLDQAFEGLPPVELRANVSLYDSKVDGVPGPDNRLDQQSRATANLGADYRFRGTPLTLGGNVNWVPETTTRLAADQTSTVTRKRQWDVFALWTFSPSLGLRLLANNLDPLDYATTTVNEVQGPTNRLERVTSTSGGPSFTNWQFRVEMKL